MKKAQRLEPIRDIARNAERSCASRVAGMERRLIEAEQRFGELQRYLAEYESAFVERGRQGVEVRRMREYQSFLARLQSAIDTQSELVVQLRRDVDRERSELRSAMVRRQALSKVIEKAHAEQKHLDERRLQHEIDERAQALRGDPR